MATTHWTPGHLPSPRRSHWRNIWWTTTPWNVGRSQLGWSWGREPGRGHRKRSRHSEPSCGPGSTWQEVGVKGSETRPSSIIKGTGRWQEGTCRVWGYRTEDLRHLAQETGQALTFSSKLLSTVHWEAWKGSPPPHATSPQFTEQQDENRGQAGPKWAGNGFLQLHPEGEQDFFPKVEMAGLFFLIQEGWSMFSEHLNTESPAFLPLTLGGQNPHRSDLLAVVFLYKKF